MSKLSEAQERNLLELLDAPYWHPSTPGEWAVARALERRGLLKRNVSSSAPPYELNDAGRAAGEQLRARATDPYWICCTALREHWHGEAYAKQIVQWMIEALDAAGDRTIPRCEKAREDAVVMVGMVMADLGDETSIEPVVSHALRAMEDDNG